MPANTQPIFTLTPVCTVGQVTTANTNRDGTGTIATIFTAGADGSRIEAIEVVATVSTTQGVVRLYIHDGTNIRLLKELLVPAITAGTSIEVWREIFVPAVPLVLPSTHSIRASTHIGETFNVFVHGGNF